MHEPASSHWSSALTCCSWHKVARAKIRKMMTSEHRRDRRRSEALSSFGNGSNQSVSLRI